MIQKQKVDAQYFKLIGVTLMMVAFVSDAESKRSFCFDSDNVREIILEQFQQLSSEQLAEVIEWENAVLNNFENPNKVIHSNVVYYQLFKNIQLKVSLDNDLILDDYHCISIPLRAFDYCCETHHQELFFESRNKHSLVTRAGPLA